jgi:hypothetical protein
MSMKNRIKNIAFICGISLLALTTSCSDVDDEIKSVTYSRLFSPTDVQARVQNKTNVRLSWEEVNGADAYTIELFANDNLEFAGTPAATYNDITENPYTITGLMGETQYSVRIKAIGQNIVESKWSGVSFETEAEQILQSIAEDDLKATEVTLRWPAGQTATEIILTPGDISHSVTADEISAGAATISGLSSETEYTAKLMNGTKTRGSIKFTTLIDFGDAIPVNEGDDLKSLLDEAKEGDSFILVSGEFNIENYVLTKSVKIAGLKPSSKPIINGRFTVASDIASLTLSNIIFDGKKTIDNILELTAEQGKLSTLNIDGCEIRNMAKHIIYNNKKGTFGNITINNSIIDGIANDAGDGFDLRGGALTSLTVSNTTISNGIRSLVRCQVVADVTFEYCTFYNICTNDDSNNTGLFRVEKSGSKLIINNCLAANIGLANPTNANSGTWGRADKLKADEDIKNIFYFNSPNLWTNSHKADFASFATEADPGFKDAANGDFSISNEDMIDKKIGDPRWIK